MIPRDVLFVVDILALVVRTECSITGACGFEAMMGIGVYINFGDHLQFDAKKEIIWLSDNPIYFPSSVYS